MPEHTLVVAWLGATEALERPQVLSHERVAGGEERSLSVLDKVAQHCACLLPEAGWLDVQNSDSPWSSKDPLHGL